MLLSFNNGTEWALPLAYRAVYISFVASSEFHVSSPRRNVQNRRHFFQVWLFLLTVPWPAESHYSQERGCIIMTFPSALLPGQMFLDQMKPEEPSSCKIIG